MSAQNLKELSASYHEFTKLKLSISLPMPAPTIPVLSMELKTSMLLSSLMSFLSNVCVCVDVRNGICFSYNCEFSFQVHYRLLLM